MALRIDTFDNVRGGNTLYKALTPPGAAQLGHALVGTLRRNAPIAVYDPDGAANAFNEIFSLEGVEVAGAYVQQTARVGERVLGRAAAPVTELSGSATRAVFIAPFAAERRIVSLRPRFTQGAGAFTPDARRTPGDHLTH